MSSHHVTIVLFSLLAVISAATALGGGGTIVGGYKPIKNLSDPYVLEVAKFAVDEHNKQEKDSLKVVKIVKGESQVVSGTNYRLTISTSDNKQYVATVYDQPWTHTRKLVAFKAV